ncbi:MAG: hypothetical protein LBG17_00380 [Bacteroidales bacterium]|jgi:hypothetical protein|nr:hypothetical protein [Bacteroidales bacterium]
MNRIKTLLLMIIAVILFSGCSVLMSKIYGVHEISYFDEDKYANSISKIKKQIHFVSLISDSTQYKQIINSGRNAQQRHLLGQPVQILYFEKNILKSYHNNCFAKGKFTRIDWNTDNRFSCFLPATAVETDTIPIKLYDYAKIYNEIKSDSSKNYTIIIFWTFLLEKTSQSAINTTIENIYKFDKINDVDFYLINTDKYFVSI